MDMIAADAVHTEERDGVLLITLNRPHKRNAIDLAVARGIAAALDRLDGTPSLRIGIITGAGNGFCAGMDLSAFANGERPYVEGRGFAGIVEQPPAKPLIAAIEGFAVAGGFEVALACDLIVAARGALLGIPEVKRGLVAAGGGLLRLPDRLPYHVAMELALTGEPISAERAAELGLVNRIVEPGESAAAAHELACSIATNGPLAVGVSKQLLIEARQWPAGERWARQARSVERVMRSEDAREGSLAFTEKRLPVWRGR